MMLNVSLSKIDWMDISQLLEQISLKVLRGTDLPSETEVFFSRIYHLSQIIRLEILKNSPSYNLLRKELENIDFEKFNNEKSE